MSYFGHAQIPLQSQTAVLWMLKVVKENAAQTREARLSRREAQLGGKPFCPYLCGELPSDCSQFMFDAERARRHLASEQRKLHAQIRLHPDKETP